MEAEFNFGPFDLHRNLLMFVGITLPKQSAYMMFYKIKRIFFLFVNFFNFFNICVYLVLEPTSLMEKLIPLIYCTANSHVCFNQIILIWQEDEVEELYRNMEALYEREFVLAHKELLNKEWKLSRILIIIATCCTLSFLVVAMCICALENYLFQRNNLPFYLYCPIDGQRYTVVVWIYQTISMLCPVITMTIETSFVIVVGRNFATLLKMLRINIVDRGTENYKRSQQIGCYKFHADILKLIHTFNEMYSFTLLLQIFLCSVQCCFGGYALFKTLSSYNDPQIVSVTIIFVNTLIMPWIICASGNAVTVEAERLYNACYQNLWYNENNSSKQELLIMLTAATKPVNFHYKFLAKYDMERSSMIMRAAYSYATLLQTMDF